MNHESAINSILGLMAKIDPEERICVIQELAKEICFSCGSLTEVCYCEFED